MSWEIKSKINEVKFEVEKVEYNDEWMQERYVTVTIESPAPINFQIGDYLIYRGERFEINYDPGKIKSAEPYDKGNAFRYENVKFNSLADELTRCDFLDVVLNDNQLHFTGLPKFSFYGGVKQLADRIQANLDKTYGKGVWNVVIAPEFSDTTELSVAIDTQKVSGVLADVLVNQFKTYYTIKGRTLTIGAAGVPADHLFQWGPGKGLYEIEESAEADQQIVTRLRAYGSTRNLPHRYYNSLTDADGKALIPDNMAVQYLMLPSFPYTTQDPYIDSKNIGALGVREDSIFFDGSGDLEEIYPSIEGMTAEQLKAAGVPCNAEGALDVLVRAEQMTDNGVGKVEGDAFEGNATTTAEPATFKVTIKDVGFDINDHLTTEGATISFKSGMLGGRDFEIVECKKEGNNYVLELNRVYDEDIKLWFPYKDYNAKKDDKFVLLNIRMPEVYIKAASQRLLEAAEKWLAKNDYSRSVYAPKIDELFMARQHDAALASGGTIKSLHDTLCAGMQMLFEDEDLGISNAAIFIDRLTIIEGEGSIPTYEVVLKEEKTVGRLDKMQNQIDSLAAGQGQGSGGYNASQIRSLINAYGGQYFLSKLKDDRSAGKITSDKGFDVGDFLAGVSGARLAKDAETGQTILEVDRIYARVKAIFESLVMMESSSVAGKVYVTPGGSVKCTSVDESETAYRCWFLSEQDGEKTETKIIAGDQAISELFNAAPGESNKVSNHRYWRLVTAVNNDARSDNNGNHYGYIDLSKSDCEFGSDIPKAGDVIEQFGSRDNVARRAAIVFSTVDADAPSIKLLTGIGSGDTTAEHYSLDGRDIIAYGYDAVEGNAYFRCYGDHYVGAPDGSTGMQYKANEKSFELHNVSQRVTAEIDGLRTTLSGMNGTYSAVLGGKTIGTWWGGDMVDRFYDEVGNKRENPLTMGFATALVRLDGSAYFGKGNFGFEADGTGWLGSYERGIRVNSLGVLTLGSGVQININGGEEGLKETLESLVGFNAGITNLLTPVDKEGDDLTWAEAAQSDGNGGIRAKGLRANVGFWSTDYVSSRGTSDGSGGGIDEDFLAQWLVDNNYAKKSDMPSLVGYATQIWVQGQGYLTSASLSSYLTKTEASSLYQPKGNYLGASALNGYATEAWVNSQGFLKGHQSLANYVTLDTAQEITGAKTFDVGSWVLKATERNEIKDVSFGNGTVGQGSTSSYSAIRRGIDFRWYDTHWIIGNIRGGSVDSNGFGIGLLNSDNKIDLGLRVTKDKVYSAGYATFNGTSSQFLKADGSVDESHYIKTDRKQTFNWVWKYNPTHIVGFDSSDSSNMYVFDGATVRAFANAVNKSGDTMTGGLTISSDSYGGQLTVHRVNAAGGAVIKFSNSEKELGLIGIDGSAGSYPYDTVFMKNGISFRIWHSGNDGSGSGLDADLLDGLNSTDFARSLVGAGYVWNNNETVAEWSKRIASKPGLIMPSGWGWSLSTSLVLGSHTIDSQRYTAIDIRNGNLNYSWNQKAYMFLPAHSDVSMIYIAQMICENTAGQVATSVKRYADYDTVLASNVASATRLKDTFTLWGQNFYGNNVSGSLSGVNHISPSANNTYDIGSPSVGFRYGYFHWLGAPTGATLTFGANNATHMAFLTNGNVGIGTTSPAYKAHVIGSVAASGDFRCLSQGGGIWFHRTGESNYIKSGDADNFAMFWDSEPESTRHSANLEIYSHCGIAFKTSCGGQARSGKIAVGIDTRNGNLKAAGWIRSNSLISDDWLLVGGGYIYWDDKNSALYTPTEFYSNETIAARGTASTSDMRLKRIVAPMVLSIDQIAEAPLFVFDYRDTGKRAMGSSAQYWEKITPEAVWRIRGYRNMQYDTIALAVGISLGRELQRLGNSHRRWLEKHESRLQKAERKMREQQRVINDLNQEIELLKSKIYS